jgi:hypothetical protein
MRWFKHLSGSHQDEDMAEIISRLGPEGYGVWWIILEVIALQMDSSEKYSARYSAKKWGSFCGFSAKKFQKVAENLAEISSISVNVLGDFLEIECPNLLKYRDEYSKKSGQTPDKLRSKIEIQKQKQKQSIEEPITPCHRTDDGDTRKYDSVPYVDLVAAYHKFCPSLPRVKEITDKRKKALRAGWKKYAKHEGGFPHILDTVFKKAEASDFLAGRTDRWSGANFDWLLKEANMVKVIEGNYDNKENSNGPTTHGGAATPGRKTPHSGKVPTNKEHWGESIIPDY